MVNGIFKYWWWVFTLRGLISLAFGFATLSWPTITLDVMILLFGFFALFEGALTIVASFGKGEGKSKWTLLFEGIAGLLVSYLVIFGSSLGSILWPKVAAVMLVYYIAVWAILTGLLKIITAFQMRTEIKGGLALGSSGLLSIFVGLILILRAGGGVLTVSWLIGIFGIILGICLTLVGLKFRPRQISAT